MMTALVLALPMATAWTVSGAPIAQATMYRYWTYWWADGSTWTFATAGPASALPEDGSVEGWRFGIAGLTGDAKKAPAVDPSDAFARACATTPAEQGRKRVALVIDPGTPEHAPANEQPGQLILACASTELSASGYQVLRSITEVRTDDGLVCAIGGYPATGCAEPVDTDELDTDELGTDELDTGELDTDHVAAGALPVAAPGSAAPTSSPAPDSNPAPDSSSPGPVPLVVAGLAIGAMIGFIWRRRRPR